MRRFPTGVPCDRACTWAALAPDNELSELERRLLDAHVARCGPCSRFAAQVTAVAAALRAAAPQRLGQPIAIPTWRRRSVHARLRAAGAAAAVAVMALGIASRAPLPTGEPQAFQSFNPAPVLDFSGGDQAEHQALRDARREAIVAALDARNRPAGPFGDQPA